MPKGTPLTEEAVNRKRHEIFSRAAPLFLNNGFIETSIREIAETVGMSKPNLYNYFHTKDDILIWFFQDDADDMIALARDIAIQQLPAIEKIQKILHKQMGRMLANKQFYLKFLIELQRLGAESRQHIRLQRHALQDLLSNIVEQGIREGTFRQVNPLLAAHMLIMTILPATFTSRPIGSPEEMLDEALTLFLRGVQV